MSTGMSEQDALKLMNANIFMRKQEFVNRAQTIALKKHEEVINPDLCYSFVLSSIARKAICKYCRLK